MNLTTSSGLSLTVDDLTAFAGEDGVHWESFSRIVVGGLVEFTSWLDCYETFTLTAPVRELWPEIEAALNEAALNEAAANMRRSDVIERAYLCRLADENGIHGV